ncbi:MAG TPA: hypothetical protein VIL50_05020, partial [Candidatus Limnocylindrales bacterium]
MHDRPDKKADDLLSLLIRQASVQAGTQLVDHVDGDLGQSRAVSRLQGRHATLQFRLLGADPVKLGVEFGVVEAST